MDPKLLTEGGWKAIAAKFKIRDSGLQKALCCISPSVWTLRMMGNVGGSSRGVEVEEFGLISYPQGWIYFTKDCNDYQVRCHTPKWIALAWKGQATCGLVFGANCGAALSLTGHENLAHWRNSAACRPHFQIQCRQAIPSNWIMANLREFRRG